MRRVSLAVFFLIVSLGVVGGVVLGCQQGTSVAPVAAVKGPHLSRAEAITPAAAPPKDSILTISGSPFKVKVVTERHGTHFQIVALNDGQEFDREQYEDSVQAFRLLQAGGEHYEPPIDLLRFPMTVGETWDWKGQIVANGNPKLAEAQIQTSDEKQYVSGAPVEAVQVRVTLSFPAVGGDEPARRVLTFWFAKEKGLFRRQYDWVSVREPAP
ncbi:MAG: hypothetical protein ACO1SV_19830 [Fimbriimonas sp.]